VHTKLFEDNSFNAMKLNSHTTIGKVLKKFCKRFFFCPKILLECKRKAFCDSYKHVCNHTLSIESS